jgi:hypothetical protein
MNRDMRLSSLIMGVCAISCAAQAQVFTLTDTNTSARIVADNPVGMEDWTIEGNEQVVTNTYLWRVGDSGTADFIQNLALTSSNLVTNQFLMLTYTNAAVGFAVDVTYFLSGGTSNYDIAEVVRIRNTGNTSLNFRLFQYNDFDLMNTKNNDLVERVNSTFMDQSDGILTIHDVLEGTAPVPDFSQLGTPFLAGITGTTGYNLDTAAGAGLGQSFSGDAAYAFQWNRIIDPGQNFTISTNKIAYAPEPGTFIALGLGALVLFGRKRRK